MSTRSDSVIFTTRVLPPAEWPGLVGTELEVVWPHMRPQDSVVVVEDRGDIVGCWALLTVKHVEGLWIAPAHRGRSSVGRRLLAGMGALVGPSTPVFTAALTDDVRQLLSRIGTRLPGDHYVLNFGGMRCQQR
jgi:hypothetical protein